MSRIYEALQRAEMERKNKGNQDTASVLGDLVIPTVCDPLPFEVGVDLDNVSRYSWMPSLKELPALADRGRCVEQFRSLRSNLHLLRLQQDFKTILVSSGLPAEGKTFLAVNLVLSLAHNTESNVLLIDADLRRPTTHKLLGTSAAPGLAEYLEGTACLSEIIQRSATPTCSDIHVRSYSNVAFIPAGNCSDSTLELVSSHRMDELVSRLSPHFEWIVLDSPPVLAVTDAVDLARVADAVLLVARAGSTPYPVVQKVQQTFSGSRLLGFVLNATKNAPRQDHYYSYYYDIEPGSHDTSRRTHGIESRK